MSDFVDSYTILDALVKEDGKNVHYEMFISELENQLILVGYRPKVFKEYYTINACTCTPLGKLVLPKGKSTLTDLIKGDVLRVKNGNKPGELDKAIFQEII